MRSRSQQITVDGLIVDVVRKRIKNLYLRVESPHGSVRITAPLALSDAAIRQTIAGRFAWIQSHQARIAAQPRQPRPKFITGESHDFLGKSYPLHVLEYGGVGKLLMRDDAILEMHVRPNSTVAQRQAIVQRWYRAQLEALIPPLVDRWQPILGVRLAEWRVKRMRTKWGTCNIAARRIWLNLELAKRPAECLEYVVVHELVHLLERYHNQRFKSYMNKYLPQWRLRKEELNSCPITS